MKWLHSQGTLLMDTASGELSEGEYLLYEGNEGNNVVILEKGEAVHRIKTSEELEGMKEVQLAGMAYYHVFKDDEGVVSKKRVEKTGYDSLKTPNTRPSWQ